MSARPPLLLLARRARPYPGGPPSSYSIGPPSSYSLGGPGLAREAGTPLTRPALLPPPLTPYSLGPEVVRRLAAWTAAKGSFSGLSDMPLPTPIAYLPPEALDSRVFGGFAVRGPRHQNGSLGHPLGMGSAPADCS